MSVLELEPRLAGGKVTVLSFHVTQVPAQSRKNTGRKGDVEEMMKTEDDVKVLPRGASLQNGAVGFFVG